jgi:5-formyltetrahydrofolate cyclo-ligase
MLHTKTEWRRVLLDARCALPPGLRRSHSATIAERVRALPAFAVCRALVAYRPIGAEVDPTGLLALAAGDGRSTYVPAAAREPHWEAWSVSGQSAATPTALRTLDESPLLVLVPGVGFDPRATRLGRGAGFYDRALVSLRDRGAVVVVGLAFEVQIVPVLPADPWDQPVDLIVTEARVIVRNGDVVAPTARDVEEVSNS